MGSIVEKAEKNSKNEEKSLEKSSWRVLIFLKLERCKGVSRRVV